MKFTEIQTILKGLYNDCMINEISYIELLFRHGADFVLRGIGVMRLSLTGSSRTPFRFTRAKTDLQLSRSYAFRKAKNFVEKHAAAQNKAVSIT